MEESKRAWVWIFAVVALLLLFSSFGMGGYSMMGFGMGFGFLFMLLFWGLIIWLIVTLINASQSNKTEPDSLTILKLFSDFEHIKSFEEEHTTPWSANQLFLYSIFRKKGGKK